MGPPDAIEETRPLEEGRLELPHLLWVFALFGATVFLVLEPLVRFAVFGSDTGEYYRLTASIALNGHLPAQYLGWGSAYPDFPGTFLLAAAAGGATGVDALSAVTGAIPIVAALSVLPLFQLFRRVFPNDSVALVGAGLATVAFPRIFSLAHPAPLALGDFFVIAALWMFVEGRRDVRWYLPLAITSAALVATHHLSSFFFIVSALGSLVLVELYRPGAWSRRFPLRELAFAGAFLLGLFAFWFEYARSFLPTVSQGGIGTGPILLVLFEGGAVATVVLAGASLRWRRTRPWPRSVVRMPSDRSVARDYALLLAGTFVGILAITAGPLPGTTQTTTVAAVVYFTPMLAIVALAAGTRRLVSASRLGPWVIAWLTAVGLSALAALALSNPTISPARHAEYLVIPLGLLVAIGVGRLIARSQARWGRPALLAGGIAVVLLIAANGAIAYPPPSDFGGFQEGLTNGDAALWGWAGVGVPSTAVVASDHRLSSMLFGMDGNRATWDSTPALFTGSDPAAAARELESARAPHDFSPIDAVALDGTMRDTGVALDPSALAQPMSASANAWFLAPPFVPVYENGPQTIYWVEGPVTALS
ncbi:MAG: hypothetical protein L3J95_02785 [Thermoplasmata archaeon]|nr:hypothetical protein [Thermoplasmata archaeon]MCI4359333.1 hypothetical protein [Thermoplasmata archaeon]